MGAKVANLTSIASVRSSSRTTPTAVRARPPTSDGRSGLRTRAAYVRVLLFVVEAVIEAILAPVPDLEGPHAHVGVHHDPASVLLRRGLPLEVHVETAVVVVEEVDPARSDRGLRRHADAARDEQQCVADTDLHLQGRVALRELGVAEVDHELARADPVAVVQVG